MSKINIDLKEKTLEAIDKEAKKHGMKRKAYVLAKLGVDVIEKNAK